MKGSKIMIVEDEILIAEGIQRFLRARGYHVTGIAISYEEAQELVLEDKPDLILLDIRLSGTETGIDFAHYLLKNAPTIPFLYLTSQMDAKYIHMAKETLPAGYLSKPFQREDLYASIEMALYRKQVARTDVPQIKLFDGNQNHLVFTRDITFLRADHVYVKVHLEGGKVISHRSTLKTILSRLPPEQFARVHRSYVVNVAQVTNWDHHNIQLGSNSVPISRSRRQEILDQLTKYSHLLLLVFFSAALQAQPVLDRLAAEVCDCMTLATNRQYPRKLANNCLKSSATANAADLLTELSLSAENASDRRQLGELLVDRLVTVCPILQTFSSDIQDKYRYRDTPADTLTQRFYRSPKVPPADSLPAITSEAPDTWEVTGTLVGKGSNRELRVRTTAGELLVFGVAPRLLRNTRLRRGQTITLRYRREWQKGGGRILLSILSFQ